MTKSERMNLIMLGVSWANIGLPEVIDVIEKTPLHRQGIKHHTQGLKKALESQSKQVYQTMKGHEQAELEMYNFDSIVEEFLTAIKNISIQERNYNTLIALLKAFNSGEGIREVSDEEYERLSA